MAQGSVHRGDSEPISAGRLGSQEASLTRRQLLEALGAGVAVAALGSGVSGCGGEVGAAGVEPTPGPSPTPTAAAERQIAARDIRRECADIAFARGMEVQAVNGDEARYPNRIASYSKGLPHDTLGEVEPQAYDALLAAVASGAPDDFEAIRLGGTVKLANPQGGLSFDLEGPDAHALALPAPPRFDSAEAAGEMVELYWMALTRDVHFTAYVTDPMIAAAADDLSQLSDFRGWKVGGRVRPETIFRGTTLGDQVGPYLSQFLLRDFAYGSFPLAQRQRTPLPGIDYLSDFPAWLSSQTGMPAALKLQLDPMLRYIRNLRDLARYVQVDPPYAAYVNACLILFALGVPVKPGNPYKTAHTQAGFVTFGGPHILGLVAEAASRALKAVWYQKWFVHRRLRPEAYGGRVEVHARQQADYPLHADVLNSGALAEVQARTGTALLPMAYPEGSPTHPTYGAGHNTIAGACVTMLKAWFAEDFVLPNPVVASADGTALEPYTAADAAQLSVGGELDKLAGNIAAGRNAAGVHWRSDYFESIKLGERVAIGILEEQKVTFNEASSFTFTSFDGATITI